MVLSMKRILFWAVIVTFFVGLTACNKDDVFTVGDKPIITFSHEDGIYEVNLGDVLTLAPEVENGIGAEYVWTLDDGTVVCRGPVWTHTWNLAGQHYVLLTVSNPAGVDREEVRIDVTAPMPPAISLALPIDGLTILKSSSYTFKPLFGNVTVGETLTVDWLVDGEKMAEGESFEFCRDVCGEYSIVIRAANSAGVAEKEFRVKVVEELPVKLNFMPLSALYSENVRTTIVGRPVALSVVGENVKAEELKWSVNGESADCRGALFVFSAEKAGRYTICVEAQGVVASMIINVAEKATISDGVSSVASIIEYLPAPGQFIGENSSIGGMPTEISTHEAAINWANDRMDSGKFVSLGAWGGYLIAKFNNSVSNSGGDYDFAIMGNAITGSSEPGIVWVMQDVNGNGEPDDAWYELRGSDFTDNGSSSVYSVTYYKPAGDAMAVQWSDIYGMVGTIDYLAGVHDQPSYYPVWVEAESYTLFGSQLPPRNEKHPVTGMWSNNPFDWGYADNLGSDLLDGDTHGGAGVWIGFKISNAVLPNGSTVNLESIDFVKIQTGIMTKCDNLGELSTEVLGIKKL